MKAGYGNASGRFYPLHDKSGMVWGKPSAGVIWKYFSPQQIVGGFSLELEYQARGYRLFDGTGIISNETSYTTTTRSVSSITMPVVWQPHLYIIDRRVRVFASLGVTLSYNLGTGDKVVTSVYGFDDAGNRTVTSTSADYTMHPARDVRWNYGWLGGFGVGVLTGRWEIFAEGRYYWGLSDILRQRGKFQFHEDATAPLRSELNNVFISVGTAFRLGKGGILAPPLRRRAAPPAGDNDFRNIRLNM